MLLDRPSKLRDATLVNDERIRNNEDKDEFLLIRAGERCIIKYQLRTKIVLD